MTLGILFVAWVATIVLFLAAPSVVSLVAMMIAAALFTFAGIFGEPL